MSIDWPMRDPKILVVDDFAQFRQFIVSTLKQKAKLRITAASNGVEALQKARDELPDLILIDIGLPDLNGLEVAERMRRLAVPPRIVFITQESSPEVVGEALNLGALGYVHKQRARTDLLPAIEAALEGRRFVSRGLQIGPGVNAKVESHHQILFCSEAEAMLNAIADFVAGALKSGNAALLWASKSRRDQIHSELLTRGVHVNAAIERGTYAFVDVDESAEITDAINRLSEAALQAGKSHPRVALCSERAGRTWAEGKTDEAIRLEQRANEIARHHDIDILCPYPLPHGDEDHSAFKKLCAEHSSVSFR